MENFVNFSSGNKCLKNITNCWHVNNNNNNNNLLDTALKLNYCDELTIEQQQLQLQQQPTSQEQQQHEQQQQQQQQRNRQRDYATTTTTTTTTAFADSTTTTTTLSGTGTGTTTAAASYEQGNVLAGEELTLTTTTTTTMSAAVGRIEDEGGGATALAGIEQTDKLQIPLMMTTTAPTQMTTTMMTSMALPTTTPAYLSVEQPVAAGAIATTNAAYMQLPALDCDGFDAYGLAAAAAALSPTEVAAGGLYLTGSGGTGAGSNRTSMNNSTENLSYASDNYYPDDLILLDDDDDDDDDEDAEEISLNSDDCVYAYRGDGADFELAENMGRIGLDMRNGCVGGGLLGLGMSGGGIGACAGGSIVGIGAVGSLGHAMATDDETEFLEMDFEPDPASEAENLSFPATSPTGIGMAVDQRNLLLMQRDFSQLSNRHTHLATGTQPRQHYSSPIDDLPPQQALQTQAQRLNKNFARINLHLDQIKGIGCGGVDDDDGIGCNDDVTTCAASGAGITAHSLPNTLYSTFGRDMRSVSEDVTAVNLTKSPQKVTGAKPKRFATYSTSSSVSSKNSIKSRSSLRATTFGAGGTHGGSSVSFDERCVSCTDFRTSNSAGTTVGPATAGPAPAGPSSNMDDCTPMLAAAAAAVLAVAAATAVASNACIDLSTNEETCLDCLEKEFLANTIGKELDLSECAKCRKRCSSLSLYTRAAAAQAAEESRVRSRSGSPNYFLEMRDDCIFSASNMPSPRKRNNEWNVPTTNNRSWDASCYAGAGDEAIFNQRITNERTTTQCDNMHGSKQPLANPAANPLLATLLTARISTLHLSEDGLVQALDKLHISYNADLISAYFKNETSTTETQISTTTTKRIYKNLKEFLLHESKRYGNYYKIKKLIDMATQRQISVQFKKDPTCNDCELIPIKVRDIMQHWANNKDLNCLKNLDKRYHEANVLGKVAYIVRVMQQMSVPRRPMSDFILIPQYYARGELILTRKC